MLVFRNLHAVLPSSTVLSSFLFVGIFIVGTFMLPLVFSSSRPPFTFSVAVSPSACLSSPLSFEPSLWYPHIMTPQLLGFLPEDRSLVAGHSDGDMEVALLHALRLNVSTSHLFHAFQTSMEVVPLSPVLLQFSQLLVSIV